MTTPEPNFLIQNIYTKDISFESPNAPEVFNIKGETSTSFDNINISINKLPDSHFEVNLHLTLKTEVKDKVIFLADVTQAGIFKIENFNDEQLETILNINCPTIIFPYIAETIANLVQKGGFPALHLVPMDFAMLYQKHQEQQNG